MAKKKRARATGPADRKTTADHSAELALALRERIKELECLYTISSLREASLRSPEQFLQGVVEILPRAWQFPEHTSAQIRVGSIVCQTEHFREGPWQMSADVREDGRVIGKIAVYYSKGVPALPEGPFLREEHALLRVIAERVGTTLRHMQAEAELAEANRTLRAQHQIVQERNITLRSVLATLEEEKREIRSNILANIQRIIMPIVFELELSVAGRQRSYVTLLRQSLQEIASPFYSSLARDHSQLTPVEVAISTMIRNGMSTKEIAQLRCISPATVHRHRENIRKKLGLQNQSRNLATYLQGAVRDTASDARQSMIEEPPSLVGGAHGAEAEAKQVGAG